MGISRVFLQSIEPFDLVDGFSSLKSLSFLK